MELTSGRSQKKYGEGLSGSHQKGPKPGAALQDVVQGLVLPEAASIANQVKGTRRQSLTTNTKEKRGEKKKTNRFARLLKLLTPQSTHLPYLFLFLSLPSFLFPHFLSPDNSTATSTITLSTVLNYFTHSTRLASQIFPPLP